MRLPGRLRRRGLGRPRGDRQRRRRRHCAVPGADAEPAIDVDSPLEQLGLDADHQLAPPDDPDRAGWYRHSPTPGELGPAVLAGHVDSPAGPAVFHRLGSLRAGDPVRVERADGRVAVFRVDRVTAYDKDAFPTRAVYGDLPHAGLRLITCGGSYDADRGGHQANVVVFATFQRLARPQPNGGPSSRGPAARAIP